jgi:osmoprotectant transport system substrate-binding protein
MTTSIDQNNKELTYIKILIIVAVIVYEAFIITFLCKELFSTSLRATWAIFTLLGLLFLPLLIFLLSKSKFLGVTKSLIFKAGSFQVEIQRLEQKIEEKSQELYEQLEGKLSTAEQTLYPLVGGPNAFTMERLKQKRIIIGSKNFAANIVIAEFVAQYLESNGIQCDRRFRYGGTATNYAALSNGWIDLFVDYTGTGCLLFNINFHKFHNKNSEQILNDLLKELNKLSKERFQFEWMQPLGTKTDYCVVMKQAFADENSIVKISDINEYGLGKLRFCANYEFMNRLDGFLGLKKRYNLKFLTENVVSYSETYNYLVTDKADVTVGHTTDPDIKALKLKTLEDDLQYFPDYFETPLVRTEALKTIPGLKDHINEIKNLKLTNDDISTMIHDYNSNAESLTVSVKNMLERKKKEKEKALLSENQTT